MNKKNSLLILLAIVTVIYYFPIVNFNVGAIDESFALVGAERTLNGQVPYRDFSSEYPPGQYYTLAALFRLFGTSVTTERIYDVLIKSLLSIMIFLIIRLLSSSWLAFTGWLMSLVWILNSPYPAYAVYPAVLFIYLSIYCLLLHHRHQENYYIVLSALFAAVSVLFRHDLGGFTALVITALLIFRSLTKVQSWKPPIFFIAGGIAAGLPVIMFFVMNSGIASLLNDLVIIPFTYLKHQALPYPALSRWTLPFFVFPAVIILSAVTSLIMTKRDKNSLDAYGILLISLIGLFCFDRIRMRPDKAHLLPVALTAILLAPLLIHSLTERFSPTKWLKNVMYVIAVVVLAVTLSRPVETIHMILSRSGGYTLKNINPDISRARHQPVFENIKKVVSYIKGHSLEDDYIYVGVKNHDKFIFNDLLIYFLAERNYASRYHGLNPGVQTTAAVQNEMINEFKIRPPRMVILGSRTWNEQNLSGIDTHVDLLDNYIAANFELKEVYGPYEIWMK